MAAGAGRGRLVEEESGVVTVVEDVWLGEDIRDIHRDIWAWADMLEMDISG